MNADQYAAGWGTLALVNAGIAQGKGRSGLIWCLISLLFGPLATLLLVLLPIRRGVVISNDGDVLRVQD